MIVRRATPDDATGAVAVLRSSITELCADDHQNDPATLTWWLHNKTTEAFTRTLLDPGNRVVFAELDGVLSGVGLLTVVGELRLCYVKPGWQLRGIGTAIMTELEDLAQRLGLNQVRLTSSLLAPQDFTSSVAMCPPGRPSTSTEFCGTFRTSRLSLAASVMWGAGLENLD